MNMPLISIIVPAYNIAPYLPRCLDSLLAQTHRNLEIIVVNDGSSDDTGAVIDSYAQKDSRIKPVHKENGGVSSARLAGIAVAKGDYIGFVDGDDYTEPEMFAHLLKNALAHNAGISHCGYQMVFPDGHIDMYYNTGRVENLNREDGLAAFLKGEYIEPGLVNKLYRRDVVIGFDLSPLWDSSIRINEDVLMNYILFSRTDFSTYEDIPFYHYILRHGSAATTKSPALHKIQDPIKVAKLIFDDTKQNLTTHRIITERYMRLLIGTSLQTHWLEEAFKAKQELKQVLRDAYKLKGLSKKILLMAFGAVYMQPLYVLVRKIYNRVTGVDKKYDLD